jgi:hypothetical protein
MTPRSRAPEFSDLRRRLISEIEKTPLERDYHPSRHENGDTLDVRLAGVVPRGTAQATLVVERFIGGGFAGQVYQARVERLDGEISGLAMGGSYAVKVQRPPSAFSQMFRDALFKVAYQGDFAAQVNPSAVMAGALWQKLLRRGAALELGRQDAIADVYGIFFDPALQSWAEIGEWVPGRTWHLEIEEQLGARFREKPQTWTDFFEHVPSPEYLNKRAFMARLVRLFHAMGAHELARQYEWWSLKSQPNVLKRRESGPGPADGLCAIDFRAGLALLPMLPMSPIDFLLILRGLERRDIVQFDRGNLSELEAYVSRNADSFRDLAPAVADLEVEDAAYRASLPDIWHHGFRVLSRPELRHDVRRGFVRAWETKGVIDGVYGRRLLASWTSFWLFLLVGLVPLAGRFVRRLQGDARYRRHLAKAFSDRAYLGHALRVRQLDQLVEWHREGRVDDERAARLASRPGRFWIERFVLGWLPKSLHRLAADPLLLYRKVRDEVRFAWDLATKAEARVAWLLEQVEAARDEGMMNAEEEARIRASIQDPFIQTYLKCVAVHFCLAPTTHVVSGLVAAWYYFFVAPNWQEGLAKGAAILAAFQVIPISPGSAARGCYVIYRMVRDRNFKDYWIAGLLSIWHYVGYLSFPIQMVARFPGLAVFLGGSWATKAARVVPVFGEKGALLEHFVFDLFFNVPLSVKRTLAGWLTRKARSRAPGRDRSSNGGEDGGLGKVPSDPRTLPLEPPHDKRG